MILNSIIGILFVSIIAFILGFGLAFLAKIFHVKQDPKIERVNEILPGSNCGACGYAGCVAYAQAIVNDDAPINLCTAGGGDVVDKLGDLLGKNADAAVRMTAKVFCLGDDNIAKKDYHFNGEEDCLAVYNYFEGERACKYACIGKGNCMRVCPVDAIKRDELNRVWVDSNICIGCEKCVAVCPTNVIHMVPLNGKFFVACSSHYNGKTVREICQKGCIACKICEKVTTDADRIKVVDNLAIVGYTSDKDLNTAALKCPVNVIVPIKTQQGFIMKVLEKERQKQELKKQQTAEQSKK